MTRVLRDLEWMRAETCRTLSVDPTNVDSAFQGSTDDPWAFIDGCLTEALDEEMAELEIDSDPERLLESEPVSWPNKQQKLSLPGVLSYASLVRIDDETHTSPGDGVPIFTRSSRTWPTVSWYDNRTLIWLQDGPGEDKILRFFYIAETNDLNGPQQEPIYIPRKFRWLLVWSAAIKAREKQGESYPPVWMQEKIAWRERMHIAFSKGRPRDPNAPQQGSAGSDASWY